MAPQRRDGQQQHLFTEATIDSIMSDYERLFPSKPVEEQQQQVQREEKPSPSAFQQPVEEDQEVSLAGAFGQGVMDSITFGMSDAPERDLLTGAGAAQIAGQIVGEIPFWVFGGGITKMLLVRGAKSLRTAAAAGGAFGKAAKLTMTHGVAAGEAATAVGVDVGRAFIGDEEDALSPTRMAINVSLPFAQSLFKVSKMRKRSKEAQDTLTASRLGYEDAQKEARDYGAGQSRGMSIPQERATTQARLDAAYQALEPDDVAVARTIQDVFVLRHGDSEHVENLVTLFRRGAPYEDLFQLHNIDDIGDYVGYQQTLPTWKSWGERASKREGKDTFVVRSQLTLRHRDLHYPAKAPSGKGEIPAEDIPTAADYGRRTAISESAVPRDPSTGQFRKIPSTLRNEVATGLPEEHMFHPIRGGSGAPTGVEEDIIFDTLNFVPLTVAPQGKFAAGKKLNEVTQNWVDRVSGWGIINDAVISSVRVIEGMGPHGRQLASLLRNTRMWGHARFGQGQADMNNAFNQMTTTDQYMQFVYALDKGRKATDEVAIEAVEQFRKHHRYVEGALTRQGVTVMMADGEIKPLLDVLQPNFFPHAHNWADIAKDKAKSAAAGKALKEKFGDVFGPATPSEIYTMYRDNATALKMPRFSALFERSVNVPGWLGDPTTAALRGDKKYKADVQETVLSFLEDAYMMVSANRHLGVPKGIQMFDDTGFMYTNLSPIQNAIKSRIKTAQSTIENLKVSGNLVDSRTARTAAFGDPESMQKAAASGDALAKEIINATKVQFFSNPATKNLPWKTRGLLEGIAKEGRSPQQALDLVENVIGARYYRPEHVRLSGALRTAQIVTKLGTLVVENVGQIAFTATKVGFLNSFKALKEIVFNWKGAQEFATESGVLVEQALRGLEADAGRSFAGTFLKRSGFRFSESLLRTHAAVSGKLYVKGLLEKVAKNPLHETSLRQLRKIGFNTDKFVKDGQLTKFGSDAINSMRGEGDPAIFKVISKMAGYETSRATQFLADVMDMPSVAASPMGKVLMQYKSFLLNTTKFVQRELVDEAARGNFAPLVRMVLTGITIGEITQNMRQGVSGEDPSTRGQQGWIRDLIGDVPDDDTAALTYLGRRFSKSDIAARLVENMIGIGYGGVFLAMLQSATTGGKLRMLEFFGGPTVGSAVDIAAATAKAFQGDPTQLTRRALREVGGPIGALVPVPLGAFVGAAAGKSLQIAAVPTKYQQERSLYLTTEEIQDVAKRQVIRRYNDVRKLAIESVSKGETQLAMTFMSEWNQTVQTDLIELMRIGALNMGVVQKLTFDGDEMRRVLQPSAGPDPGIVSQAAERISQGAERAFQ